MSNVLIDRQKIDILANAISDKSGVPVTMTLNEMVEAVDSIESNPAPTLQAKTYTVDSAGTATVTADSGYDALSSVAVSVPGASPLISNDYGFYTENNIRKWHIRGKVAVDNSDGYDEGYISEGTYYGSYKNYSAIATGTSVTPTESAQTIGSAGTMMEGAVTVNAIPSNYVGSGITRRDSTDLSASGATVTVPSGYYSAQASKAVASGTEGTPTATKGTVSNHSISVTPSVTNTAGYISGGTKNGTAVTVSASELVSGSDTVTTNDTYDVTNLAELIVNVSSGGGVTVTDEANATGTTCVITSGGSPTPPSPDIPLNTELIDFTKVVSDKMIDSDGEMINQQWYYASDYTAVERGMTFSYTAGIWTYIGFYDSSKNTLSTIYVYNDGTVDQSDSNIAHGTLSGNKLPLGVAYVRISSTGDNSTRMSLIRTA